MAMLRPSKLFNQKEVAMLINMQPRDIRWVRRASRILAILMAYITIVGLVTFSCFILEESFQTVMFGSWAAQDAGAWHHVLKASDVMEYQLYLLDTVNSWFGWIQPFAYVSYNAYVDAEDYYIEALRQKVLANAPHLMVGREVTLHYQNASVIQEDGEFIMRIGGRILVHSQVQLPLTGEITGVLDEAEGMLFLNPPSFYRDHYNELAPD
jgi:hypothetical protein